MKILTKNGVLFIKMYFFLITDLVLQEIITIINLCYNSLFIFFKKDKILINFCFNLTLYIIFLFQYFCNNNNSIILVKFCCLFFEL